MEQKDKTVFLEKISKIAEIFIMIFVAECTLGSSGRWLEIGSLSIRIILFIFAFVFSLFVVIAKFKETFLNFQILSVLCFGLWLVFCIFLGFKNGNSLGFIVSDITTFMTLALFPGFMAVMCNAKAINRCVNTVFYAACLLSVCVLVLHFVMSVADNSFIVNINVLLNKHHLGGFAELSTGIQRIYLRSEIFLQVAIVYGVWLFITAKGKKKWLIALLCGCLLFAEIISYTRGFFLGLAAAAVILLVFGIKYFKHYLKIVACMLACFFAFSVGSAFLYGGPFVAVEFVNRFNPDLIVIDTSDNSDLSHTEGDNSASEEDLKAANVRKESLLALKKEIAERPLLGHGLGKNLDDVRNDGRTEYMYLDIILKTGIIGFMLFLVAFFGFIAVQINFYLKQKKKGILIQSYENATVRNLFLTTAYLSVAVTSFFNPFLNNPMGIMLLMLTAAAVYEEKTSLMAEV